MSSVSAWFSLVFHALLVLLVTQGIDAREMAHRRRNNIDKYIYDLRKPGDELLKIFAKEEGSDKHPSSRMDPSVNIFFTINDLYIGKKMPIYFEIKDPSTTPRLLPREEADAIPFSSSKLQYLLEFLSFSEDSPQAKAMNDTLDQCESEPVKGETKFCATSLESMLDSTRDILQARLKVLTTTISRHPKSKYTLLQNYTVLKEPKRIMVPNLVACHTMPYPYAVFYCHAQKTENRLFTVTLGGENGDIVDAVAACHMDTSQWDPDFVGFRVLGIQPGSAPVCHFFPADNLVWVPSTSVI